jgi:D-amino-acid dehydrogenase
VRVTVIGGGVIGVACAYHLANAGHAVTLLDAGEPGGGCSAGNCGYVCPSHVLPLAGPGALADALRMLTRANAPLRLTARGLFAHPGWFLRFAANCTGRRQRAAGHALLPLLQSSRRLYDELLEAEGFACDWQPRGLLFVFQSPASFDHYAHTDRLLTERYGTPAERLDADALPTREPALKPGAAAGGYLYPGDAQLRPEQLLAGWRKAVERLGVAVRSNTRVSGLVGNGTRAEAAETAGGSQTADAFVIATGAAAGREEWAGRPPVAPGKGYSLTMRRPAACPALPMIFEDHRVAVSPFADGYRIGSTMEFVGWDDRVHPARLRLLRDGAAAYLREPHTEPVGQSWAGLRPMTPDGLPVIGRGRRWGNVWLATGHGMLGVTLAPSTGRLVAELVSGRMPHLDPRPYSPGRFA